MPNNGQMQFTIARKTFLLSKASIEQMLRGSKPEPIKKYWTSIGGVHFPIKQVLSVATNLPTAAFISTDAYRVLSRLGFEINS